MTSKERKEFIAELRTKQVRPIDNSKIDMLPRGSVVIYDVFGYAWTLTNNGYPVNDEYMRIMLCDAYIVPDYATSEWEHIYL